MKLIDADALKDWLTKQTGFRANCEDCIDNDCVDCIVKEAIENAPSIDVTKHGKWIAKKDGRNINYYCSVCHKQILSNEDIWCGENIWFFSNYCPHCGAKMHR